MADLLIELFSEEIPAGFQAQAAENLKKLMTNGIVDAGLTYASAAAFHTPRRLTLAIEGLLEASPTVQEERKGPKVGAPDQAIQGFLRGASLTLDDLEVRDDKKGQVYFANISSSSHFSNISLYAFSSNNILLRCFDSSGYICSRCSSLVSIRIFTVCS